jgi:SNF2-related domain
MTNTYDEYMGNAKHRVETSDALKDTNMALAAAGSAMVEQCNVMGELIALMSLATETSRFIKFKVGSYLVENPDETGELIFNASMNRGPISAVRENSNYAVTIKYDDMTMVIDEYPKMLDANGTEIRYGNAKISMAQTIAAENQIKSLFEGFELSPVNGTTTQKFKMSMHDVVKIGGSPVGEHDGMFVIEPLTKMLDSNTLKLINVEYEVSIVPLKYVNTYIKDGKNYVSGYSISYTAKITFPLTFAAYICSVNTDADIKPAYVMQYFQLLMAFWNGSLKTYPAVMRPPETTVAALQRMSKYKGFAPRVSKDGWAVLPSGLPRRLDAPAETYTQFFANANRLAEVNAALDAIYDDEMWGKERDGGPLTTQRDALQEERNKLRSLVSARTVLIDWVNDNEISVDEKMKPTVSTLKGVRPLTPSIEAELMNTEIGDAAIVGDISYTLGLINAVTTPLRRAQTSYGVSPDKPNPKAEGFDYPADRQFNVVDSFNMLVMDNVPSRIGRGNTILIKHLFGLDLYEFKSIEIEGVPQTKVVYESVMERLSVIAYGLRWCAGMGTKLAGGASLRKFEGVPAWMQYIAGKVKANPSYVEELAANEARRQEAMRQDLSLGSAPLDVPNVEVREGAFESLLPHQVEALASLQVGDKPSTNGNALVQIDTGGGKTIIAIVDAMLTVKKGIETQDRIKRPLIITQANLISDAITEVNSISNGKIRPVSLRMESVKAMIAQLKLETSEDFIRHIQSFGDETIFLAAYSDIKSATDLFEDFDAPAHYMFSTHKSYPYANLLAACGFDYNFLDESHNVKNDKSAVNEAASYMVVRAKVARLASATVVNNVVTDIHAQASMLNPSTFGNMKHFEQAFSVQRGVISKSNATRLKQRLRSTLKHIEKFKSSWAYMLPDLVNQFHYVKLTDLQTKYYDLLMREAEVKLRSELSKLQAAGKNMDELELEGLIVKALQTHLARVERFMPAPDGDLDFSRWDDFLKKGTPDDLISPIVAKVDEIIDRHFASGNADGKVMVYGYHKVVSKHILAHSRYAPDMLRYTAGDKAIIKQFKEDPTRRILVADENSIKNGQNLQCVSRVIRTQTVWTPGDFEQAISRMYRPDPRGIYNRESVNHDWVIMLRNDGEATFQVAKTARFISKAVSNANVAYEDQPRYHTAMGDVVELEPLRMNLELVFDFKMRQAQSYLDGWGSLTTYLDAENRESRRNKAIEVQKDHPDKKIIDDEGNIINMREFVGFAMKEIKSTSIIGSPKTVRWVPWLPFAKPPTVNGIELELVGDNSIAIGDNVYCEFGVAKVSGVTNASIKVETSFGKYLLNRNAVAVPTLIAGEAALAAMVGQGSYWEIKPARSDGILTKIGAPTPYAAPVAKPKEAPVDEPSIDDSHALEIKAAVINGLPALVIQDVSNDLPRQLGSDKWKKVTPFYSIGFANAKSAEVFVEKIWDKFALTSATYNELWDVLDNWKSGNAMRMTALPKAGSFRNFFLAQKRKMKKYEPTDQFYAHPFWTIFSDQIRLLFDQDTHDPEVINWLKTRATKVAGVKKIAYNKGFWVCFFETVEEAKADVAELIKVGKGIVSVDVDMLHAELDLAAKLLSTYKVGKQRKLPDHGGDGGDVSNDVVSNGDAAEDAPTIQPKKAPKPNGLFKKKGG